MPDFPALLRTFLDWATDPEGLGLPVVIGAGLGIILYFMRSSEKDWHQSQQKIEEHQEKQHKIGYPDKPF